MPFQSRMNFAIDRANYALNQLYGYNNYAHPRSEPNASIRNNARLTIDPTTSAIRQGVQEGRWEGISSRRANNALRAADLIQAATWNLSDRPNQYPNRPANVPQAVSNIREAINLLSRARW